MTEKSETHTRAHKKSADHKSVSELRSMSQEALREYAGAKYNADIPQDELIRRLADDGRKLEDFSDEELRERARDLGLFVNENLERQDLIKSIQAHDGSQDPVIYS